MKIALAQINPTVGDIPGNAGRIADCIERAAGEGADLVVFGELAVTGYPPRDLLSRPGFVAASVRAVEDLARRCRQAAALVGFVRPAADTPGRPLENAAALLTGGRVAAVHVKSLLPTYDVFDETRYFRPGGAPAPLEVAGRRVGVSICEDLWDRPALGRPLCEADPIDALKRAGAEIIVNISASPFQMGKVALREQLLARQAARTGCAIVYVNQVGGNDELIFDGSSMAVAGDGTVLGRCREFAEDLLVVDGLELAEPRTKTVVDVLARLKINRSCLLTLPRRDEVLTKSARNIPDVTVRVAGDLNAFDVATRQKMLVTREAMELLLNRPA